jgi:transmembrane sensor
MMKNDNSSPLDASRPGGRTADAPDRTTFDWPRHTGTTDAVLREMELQLRLRRQKQRRLRSAAGAAAILLIGGWLSHLHLSSRLDPRGAAPQTASLFPPRQVLPDGSVVVLGTGADVSVEFSDTIRHVILKRGEAMFDVAKMAGRPFIVRAGGVDVRAVGTQFSVSLNPATVEVLVREGQVAVEKSMGIRSAEQPARTSTPVPAAITPPGNPLAMLSARSRVVVDISPAATFTPPEVILVSDTEIADRFAWSVTKLQFSRTPLREALEAVNRHARARLVLEGAGLENVRLSGAIRADNIDALLQLLASDYGIQAEPRGETEIVLRKSR